MYRSIARYSDFFMDFRYMVNLTRIKDLILRIITRIFHLTEYQKAIRYILKIFQITF